MSDKPLVTADTKTAATERVIDFSTRQNADVDLTNAQDSAIAKSKNVTEAPNGLVGDLQLVDGKKAEQNLTPMEQRVQNRIALNDSVSTAVGGDENKILAFNTWMNEYENNMGRSKILAVAAGVQPESEATDSMNKAIAGTYGNINRLLTSDNRQALLTKEERLDVARDFMKNFAGESQENARQAEPLSKVITDIATTAHFVDRKGFAHRYEKNDLTGHISKLKDSGVWNK